MAHNVFLSCFLYELWLFCFLPVTNGTELYIPSCSNKDVRETCWFCVFFVCSFQVKNTQTSYVEFPGWKRTCLSIFNDWSYILRICWEVWQYMNVREIKLCNTINENRFCKSVRVPRSSFAPEPNLILWLKVNPQHKPNRTFKKFNPETRPEPNTQPQSEIFKPDLEVGEN